VQKPLENVWLRFVIVVLILGLLFWASYHLRGILISLVFAFIIAYIFDPIVDFFQAHRIPRTVTIALLLVLILGSIAGSLAVLVPEFVQETVQLAEIVQENIPMIQEKLEGKLEEYSGYPLTETVNQYLGRILEALQRNMPQVLNAMEGVLTGAVAYTVNIVGYIVNLILFAVVSVYLLKDFHLVVEKMEDLIPLHYRTTTLDIVEKVNLKLRGFFRGQLVVGTILAVIYFVGLTLVGVPYALLLALVGGYGQIIPYMGIVLAMIPAVLLALVKYGDFIHPLLAAAVYVIGQMLEGAVITPRVMAGKVGLHPVVIILSVLIFGKTLGFLGILIAVPLTTALIVLLQEVLVRYKKSSLYSPKALDYPGAGSGES